MSRFKDRKFTVQGDSSGNSAWVPLEQVHALLCDAMALETENERLRKAGDELAGMVGYDVPYEHQKDLESAWLAAKEGRDAK